MSAYYLFKNIRKDIPDNEFIITFIELKKALFAKIEKKSFKKLIKRLYFYFITLGKARVYLAIIDGSVVHESYVCQKCWKFPFLRENECEIGPCYTEPMYRGKGIYPKVLSFIMSSARYNNFFMIVEEKNTSSINGIKKAGFSQIKQIKKTRILKIYK